MLAVSRRFAALAPAALMSMLPVLAQAHPGTFMSSSFAAGLAHPFTGMDHMLAMFAVGLWAARLRGHSGWALPATFVIAMTGGAVLASVGLPLPAIEPFIALSVLVFGILVAAGSRVSLPASASVVAVFAVFHGHAHAIEAPTSASLMTYGAGFIAASLALHSAGLITGAALVARNRAMNTCGAAIAVAGLALLTG